VGELIITPRDHAYKFVVLPATPVEPATIQPIRLQPHTGQLQVGMTSSGYIRSAQNSWRLESSFGWISDEIQQTTVKINAESSIEVIGTFSGVDQQS